MPRAGGQKGKWTQSRCPGLREETMSWGHRPPKSSGANDEDFLEGRWGASRGQKRVWGGSGA